MPECPEIDTDKLHETIDEEILLQVSIALGAVAASTRKRLVWFGSLVLGLGGCGMFAWVFAG